jgi:hypothetical protein
MDINTYNITLIVVGVLTWLVFILGVARFSKFYLQFIAYRKELDTNLTGMGSGIKKLQNSISEMILEQRRTNKLMLELIDNSKPDIDGNGSDGNNSGDFQIEYQTPESQNPESPFIFRGHENQSQTPESPFIFRGHENQQAQSPESPFIFHGNESQHQ